MANTKFQTEQETFWAGDFGDDYIGRNKSPSLLASNVHFFSRALKHAGPLDSCIEFGANIGMNLLALQSLYPCMEQHAVEINSEAVRDLSAILPADKIYCGSILDYEIAEQYELSLVKTVLIHINSDMLPVVYKKLYDASKRYILLCEYYNPAPVTISYRGHANRLFKRDFAGELLELYSDLSLVDYGFVYRNDPVFPQDDITWFLIEKK